MAINKKKLMCNLEVIAKPEVRAIQQNTRINFILKNNATTMRMSLSKFFNANTRNSKEKLYLLFNYYLTIFCYFRRGTKGSRLTYIK